MLSDTVSVGGHRITSTRHWLFPFKTSTNMMQGAFRTVKGNSLFIHSERGSLASVYLPDVRYIEFHAGKKRNALKGLLIGGASGLLARQIMSSMLSKDGGTVEGGYSELLHFGSVIGLLSSVWNTTDRWMPIDVDNLRTTKQRRPIGSRGFHIGIEPVLSLAMKQVNIDPDDYPREHNPASGMIKGGTLRLMNPSQGLYFDFTATIVQMNASGIIYTNDITQVTAGMRLAFRRNANTTPMLTYGGGWYQVKSRDPRNKSGKGWGGYCGFGWEFMSGRFSTTFEPLRVHLLSIQMAHIELARLGVTLHL